MEHGKTVVPFGKPSVNPAEYQEQHRKTVVPVESTVPGHMKTFVPLDKSSIDTAKYQEQHMETVVSLGKPSIDTAECPEQHTCRKTVAPLGIHSIGPTEYPKQNRETVVPLDIPSVGHSEYIGFLELTDRIESSSATLADEVYQSIVADSEAPSLHLCTGSKGVFPMTIFSSVPKPAPIIISDGGSGYVTVGSPN